MHLSSFLFSVLFPMTPPKNVPPLGKRNACFHQAFCHWSTISWKFLRKPRLFFPPFLFFLKCAGSTRNAKRRRKSTPHLPRNTIQSRIISQSHGLASPSRLSHRPVPPFASQGTLSGATIPPPPASKRTRWCAEEGLSNTTILSSLQPSLLPSRARNRFKCLKWWSSGHETTEAMIANSSIFHHR